MSMNYVHNTKLLSIFIFMGYVNTAADNGLSPTVQDNLRVSNLLPVSNYENTDSVKP